MMKLLQHHDKKDSTLYLQKASILWERSAEEIKENIILLILNNNSMV